MPTRFCRSPQVGQGVGVSALRLWARGCGCRRSDKGRGQWDKKSNRNKPDSGQRMRGTALALSSPRANARLKPFPHNGDPPMLTLTESAQKAARRFIKGVDEPIAGLRISVTGGGCSGKCLPVNSFQTSTRPPLQSPPAPHGAGRCVPPGPRGCARRTRGDARARPANTADVPAPRPAGRPGLRHRPGAAGHPRPAVGP